jgi:hypothetical protein
MAVDLTTLKKNDNKRDIQKWTKEQEELLAGWSERASGYRWLHSRSEKLYRCRNYTYTIPVIILSTLTGTANFAMDSFVPEENKQLAMACVGGVNIFAGILSTLQNFLRYAELMESHRVSEVSWSKLSRDIAVELTLEPKMRKPALDFLNVCRAEYDRLIEQSPSIDDNIIKRYKSEFKKIEADFNHPHVCNGLHKCKIFEPDESEKKALIVANAGDKLLNLKRNKWNHNVDTEFKRNIKVISEKKENDVYDANDANEELKSLNTVSQFKKNDINEELKSLNTVSQFKKSFDIVSDIDKPPIEIINDIIKSVEVDIETGARETKDLDTDARETCETCSCETKDLDSDKADKVDESVEDSIEGTAGIIINDIIEDSIDGALYKDEI